MRKFAPQRLRRLQREFLPGAIEPNDEVAEEIAPKEYFGALVTDDRQFDLVALIADANEILGPGFDFPVSIALDLYNPLGHERYLPRHSRRHDRHVGARVNQRGNVTDVSGRRREVGNSDPDHRRRRIVALVVLHGARRKTRGDGIRLTRGRRSTRPMKSGTSPYFAVSFLNSTSSFGSLPTTCR